MGLCEPPEVPHGQVPGPAPGSGQTPIPAQSGGEGLESNGEGLGVAEAGKAGQDAATCVDSPEGTHVLGSFPAAGTAGQGRGSCCARRQGSMVLN